MVKNKAKDISIKVKGAREHNLKNVTVSIPRNKLVVITGVSGSGKSSLALIRSMQKAIVSTLIVFPLRHGLF